MQAPFVHLMAANRPSHFRRPFRIFASLVPPAALFSSGSGSGAGVVKRIGTFPPFIALVTAPLLLPIHYPEWSITVLRRLGETLAPLALVSVGLQLRLDQLDGIKVPLTGGIAFKLLVGPALLVLVYVEFLRATGNVVQITLFESAMGPQIGASIVAIQHGLNLPLITLLVGIGISVSFLSLPLWWTCCRVSERRRLWLKFATSSRLETVSRRASRHRGGLRR